MTRNGNNERILQVRLWTAIGTVVTTAVLASVGTLWGLSTASAAQQVVNASVDRRLERIERQLDQIILRLPSGRTP